MALAAGSRLGPYEIVGLLGSGGMGEVYRARDPRLDRDVAIKVLPDGVADRRHLRRFEDEARAAGALNHPSVLAVHDVGTENGAPYVVSELLEGHTLRARLESGPLPVHKALDLALQIARGLAAAHDKGIVHRDLKPQNIFITEDGRAKILDFGLAKLTHPGPLGHQGVLRDGETTESGTVLGTVGYMSPEQVRGEGLDYRSDIFSFGAVLYEMLSGVRAFRCDSAVETMNAILKEDPKEPPGVTIPPALAGVVRRCLEKRAPDRFRSTHDLAIALEAASASISGHAGFHSGFVTRLAARREWVIGATVAAIALTVAGIYRGVAHAPAAPATHAIDSLAVLPFENVGGDPDREYLSDGVAETLINKLSRLPDLKVMARSTSFRFRGKDVDPRQVGRDLNVGAVVTGRVSLRGETLVVGAELVDVDQGTQIWGEQYNTRMGDILAVEENISAAISGGLRVKLPTRDGGLLTRRRTEDSEAYRLYLRSRYETHKAKTPEELKRAVAYAREAIERDPKYAPAYVALSEAYSEFGDMHALPNQDARAMGRAAAMKALEIDESLPEAHTALALTRLNLDWDWAAAEREYKRAIELDPNSADAHDGYTTYLVLMGRFEEGIAHGQQAVTLDPLTPGRHLAVGAAYLLARQFDRALSAYRDALEFNPDLDLHFWLGATYREKGMYEEAIAEFRKALDVSPGRPYLFSHLGNTYARAGRPKEARECIRKLLKEDEKISAYSLTLVYAGLGEKDQALEWLEKAYAVRDQGLAYLKVDPAVDPLRTDPRFERILRRMNFPP
jgi:eukaryotic-like serine/threonine-protein kinase